MPPRTARSQQIITGNSSNSSSTSSTKAQPSLFEFFEFFPKRFAPGKRETEEQRNARKQETRYGVKNMSKNDDTDNPRLILDVLQKFERQIERYNKYQELPFSFSLSTQDLKNVSHFYFSQEVSGNFVIRLQVHTLLTQKWQTLQEVVFTNSKETTYVQIQGNTFDVTLKRLRFNNTSLDDKSHVPIFRFTCFYKNVEYISPNYFLIRTGGQKTLEIVKNYKKNFDAFVTNATASTTHMSHGEVVMLPKHKTGESTDSNQASTAGYRKVDVATITLVTSPTTPSSIATTPVSTASSPGNSEADILASLSEEESDDDDESLDEQPLSPFSMSTQFPPDYFVSTQVIESPIAHQYASNQQQLPPFEYDNSTFYH